ncbi:MAG: 4Fe-4S binding protein [Oscillospiraceae bacterium]|jgi:2-oxoglutarate ferredoxin oxidoreductase subunit delta|nr:4Fe-4S binding protein [Oscillospiraceae bacterium]
MSKAVLNDKKCKGCFLCASVCPKNALSDSGRINEKGYKIVALDTEKCIGCGACYRMCPDWAFEIVD